MKDESIEHETWLDLSDAADYLGVHFTTLRRWADSGEIACMRTPGKRRRFSVRVLSKFLAESTARPSKAQATRLSLESCAIDRARDVVQQLPASENWQVRLTDEQRARLRSAGNSLVALLLQYNGRAEGGEVFLEEGRRLTREYSQICWQLGLSLKETIHIFLFFSRSILAAVHETSPLGGPHDEEGQRLYQHTMEFLDDLILELIGSQLLIPV